MGVFASDPGDEGFELVFFGGCWAFEGSAGAAVGAAVAFGSGAGGAVAFGGVVAYQAFGVFGLTWFRLACGANLWGWLSCGGWVVGVLGTHFSAYNPWFGLLVRDLCAQGGQGVLEGTRLVWSLVGRYRLRIFCIGTVRGISSFSGTYWGSWGWYQTGLVPHGLVDKADRLLHPQGRLA